jgi:hypothetical protein
MVTTRLRTGYSQFLKLAHQIYRRQGTMPNIIETPCLHLRIVGYKMFSEFLTYT